MLPIKIAKIKMNCHTKCWQRCGIINVHIMLVGMLDARYC